MTLYEMIKKYGAEGGESTMWHSVKIISDAIDRHLDEAQADALVSEVYGYMSGGHFDEHYAKQCVQEMYYTDRAGNKNYGPFWTPEQVQEFYDDAKADIPEAYNFWDWYVAFNMLASDTWTLLHKWFGNMDADDHAEKVADLTVSWFHDPDNPYDDHKIWGYLHGVA